MLFSRGFTHINAGLDKNLVSLRWLIFRFVISAEIRG